MSTFVVDPSPLEVVETKVEILREALRVEENHVRELKASNEALLAAQQQQVQDQRTLLNEELEKARVEVLKPFEAERKELREASEQQLASKASTDAAQLSALQTELDALRDTCLNERTAHDRSFKAAETRIRALKSELDVQTLRVLDLEAQHKRHEAKLSKGQDREALHGPEVEKVRAEMLGSFEIERREMRQAFEQQLASTENTTTTQLSGVQEQLDAVRRAHEELRALCTKVKEDLSMSRKNEDLLHRRVEELRAQRKEFDTLVSTLRDELARSQAKLRDAETARDAAAMDRKNQITTMNKIHGAKLDSARKANAAAVEKLQQNCKAKIARVEKEKAEAIRHINGLKAKHQEEVVAVYAELDDVLQQADTYRREVEEAFVPLQRGLRTAPSPPTQRAAPTQNRPDTRASNRRHPLDEFAGPEWTEHFTGHMFSTGCPNCGYCNPRGRR
jgi:hypothetical protein